MVKKKKQTEKPKHKLLSWIKKYKVKSIFLILLLLIVGIFAFNKYLDWQNAQSMKQLLADFEQLERDIEDETGEELYIEADCGSVGKFATSYACSLYLRPKDNSLDEKQKASFAKNATKNLTNHGCILASLGYRLENPEEDYFICSGFQIRSANRQRANNIFLRYR